MKTLKEFGWLGTIIWFVFAYFMFGCSKHEPVAPHPEHIEHQEHPVHPEVDCKPVRVDGVHVITFGNAKDMSGPNSGGLLQNDRLIWSIIQLGPNKVVTVKIAGTNHPDDVIEVFCRGSNCIIRHHFEADK